MSTDDLYSRLEAGIKAANEGRTKDLGDFAQYAESPDDDCPCERGEVSAKCTPRGCVEDEA